MPTVSEFWDGRAQNYDARVGNHYAEAYEKTAAHFKKYLKPTDAVLDFACGTGIVTFAVAPSVQSVRAIDVSGEMVRRAQEKVKAQGVEDPSMRCWPAMCCSTSKIGARRLRASARS